MDQRQGGLHVIVRQVGIVFIHLLGHEHAFVCNGAMREGRRVKLRVILLQFVRGAAANDIKFSLKSQRIFQRSAALHENLAHKRFRAAGDAAERFVAGRHGSPSEEFLAFFLDDLVNVRFAGFAFLGIAWEEQHSDAVFAESGKIDAVLGADFAEELVRHLHQDARAVASVHFAATGATVPKVDENGECLTDDFV